MKMKLFLPNSINNKRYGFRRTKGLDFMGSFRSMFTYGNRSETIKKMVRKEKGVIYGARAVEAHISPFARPTDDYDILTMSPKKSAESLQAALDKKAGGDEYFASPLPQIKNLYRVYHKGQDMKAKTDDDILVADIKRPDRKHRTEMIGGIRYVTLNDTLRDKYRSLSEPESKYRHSKDREDIDRIKDVRKILKKRRRTR